MLDRDLADLYGVQAKRLNEQVRRNIQRFPKDFMFQLTWEESQENIRSQIATLKQGRHIKYRPYVFTQEGIAMLSSVLHSDRAIHVNIAIMRAFVRLREWLSNHENFARKLEELEMKLVHQDEKIASVFDAIRHLMAPEAPEKKGTIGFRLN